MPYQEQLGLVIAAQELQLSQGIASPVEAISTAMRVPFGIKRLNNLLSPMEDAVSTASPRDHLTLLNPHDQAEYKIALSNIFMGNAGLHFRRAVETPIIEGVQDYLQNVTGDLSQTPLAGSLDEQQYMSQADIDQITQMQTRKEQFVVLSNVLSSSGDLRYVYRRLLGMPPVFNFTDAHHLAAYYSKLHGIEWVPEREEDSLLLKQGILFEEALASLPSAPPELIPGGVDQNKWESFLKTVGLVE